MRFSAERIPQHAPAGLLVRGEPADRGRDFDQLVGGAETVGTRRRHAGAHLGAQARDAHHEKFVEVAGGDGEEAQAFQQRMVRVLGFFENAPVEMQPGELAIDEALGARDDLGYGQNGVRQRRRSNGLGANGTQRGFAGRQRLPPVSG